MLSKVLIRNFKSIEELTLDMSFAEKKAPNGYKESNILSFLEPTKDSKDRGVSVMNIYGANATGKSNIIEALFHVKRILVDGVKKMNHSYSPNKLKDLGNETFIELDFFMGQQKYSYILAYNDNSITKESLLIGEDILFLIENSIPNFGSIATKNYDENNLKERFETSCLTIYGEQNNQVNCFLSKINEDLPGLNKNLSLVFNFLRNKLVVLKHNAINRDYGIDLLAKSEKIEDVQIAFNRITEIIRKLDVDVSKFEYRRNEENLERYEVADKKNTYSLPQKNASSVKINPLNKTIAFNDIIPFHKNQNGEEIPFKMEEESVGTQLAFGLIAVILRILDDGGVLIVDELDKSLHPMVLNALVKMFKDKDYNKNDAQLISTLHATDLLEENIYKKSEFAFVNKSRQNGSFIKRLSDFEDVRNDINFRDRYLHGLYLGIPYVYN